MNLAKLYIIKDISFITMDNKSKDGYLAAGGFVLVGLIFLVFV